MTHQRCHRQLGTAIPAAGYRVTQGWPSAPGVSAGWALMDTGATSTGGEGVPSTSQGRGRFGTGCYRLQWAGACLKRPLSSAGRLQPAGRRLELPLQQGCARFNRGPGAGSGRLQLAGPQTCLQRGFQWMSPCGSVAGCRLSGNVSCDSGARGDPTMGGRRALFAAVSSLEGEDGWGGRQSRQGMPGPDGTMWCPWRVTGEGRAELEEPLGDEAGAGG